MSSLIADVRLALRLMVKSPGFTALAVLTLGLGIGANTAIFSVLDAVLLRPLPYPDSERLVSVWEDGLGGGGGPDDSVAPPNYLDWREQSTVFENMAALRSASANLAGDGEPERVDAQRVTAGFFAVLGVQPRLGRAFLEDEDRAGGPLVVILSDGLWTRRYGADPTIVGRAIILDGEPHTVVGVMPNDFSFGDRDVDLWLPMAFTDQQRVQRGAHFITVIGRLRNDVSLETARAEMTTIARRLEEAYPRFNTGLGAAVVPLQESMVGPVRPTLLVLMGAVGFVLLIACANLANMLLARAGARTREIAVRRAIGASRGRLVTQLLVESATLGALSGAVGVLFAVWGLDALLGLGPGAMLRLEETAIDGRVLTFTALASLGTGLVFGLVPALQLTSPNVIRSLRDGSQGAIGPASPRLRGALVSSEIALAAVLLIGAMLMVSSFTRLLSTDPGFDSASVLTVRVDLAGQRYEEAPARLAFYRDLIERVEALPGVRRAGVTTLLPLSGGGITLGITVEGRPPQGNDPGDMLFATYRVASPGYFDTLGVPLLRGRTFDERDTDAAIEAAIVSQAMADEYWPGEDALGKRFKLGRSPETPWKQVVGVVGDVRHSELRAEPGPTMYVPLAQSHPPFAAPRALAVAVDGDPMTLAASVRRTVWAIDPNQPVSRVRPYDDIVLESVAQPRFYSALLAAFGIVALALAAIGVYGVISYTVSQRAREIGLRLALGAQRPAIVRMIVGQGVGVAAIGLVAGVVAALALTRLLSSLLFGVTATDPTTFTIVALVLAVVAAAASYVPARRAARVDPVVSLRE